MRYIDVVRVALAVSLVAPTGCADSPVGPGDDSQALELPRALAPPEVDLLSASNRFGFELLREVAPSFPTSNVVLSPLSASAALGMALNGAGGDTFDQMRTVLGFDGLTQEEINQSYASLVALLEGLDPAVTVAITSSLWHRPELVFDTDYRQRVSDAFGGVVRDVDFADPAAAVAINDWVDQATDGTITDLLDRLDPATAVLLANAVYFKGAWTQAFDPDETVQDTFMLTDGTTTSASFMSGEEQIAFGRSNGFDVVEVPYGGQAWVMTVLLPDVGADPMGLIEHLDASSWEASTSGLDTLATSLELPKFEFSWERVLNDDLAGIGMPDAFDPAAADFTRMVAGGKLWIDQVLQKSFVRVDETGTEASAATSVHMVDSSLLPVRVDRPFVFAIRERLTGTILFLGVVRDPTA